MVIYREKIKALFKSFDYKYLFDWALVIIGIVIGTLISIFHQPYKRKILIDETILYPYNNGDTIEAYWILIIGVLLPSLTLILTMKFLFKFKAQQIHATILALFLAHTVAFIFTSFLKSSVGRLRPDFMDRCKPLSMTSSKITCTGDPLIVKEGRKSFPSGHSTHCFLGMFFLTLFILGNLRLPKSYSGRSFKYCLSFCPLMLAVFVCVTRISDYRHHWEDVVFGCLSGILLLCLATDRCLTLGAVYAYSAYRLYYPGPLSQTSYDILPSRNTDSNKPKDIQMPGSEVIIHATSLQAPSAIEAGKGKPTYYDTLFSNV